MPRKARAIVALEQEIQERVDRQLARIEAVRSKSKVMLEQYRLEAEARHLAGEPSLHGMPIETIAAIAKAVQRAATARTEPERRRAKIEEMSLRGQSVRQIAETVGLSYYYVVQVRRSLGVSVPRRKQ